MPKGVDIEVKMKGEKETLRLFAQLPSRVQKKGMRQAISACLTPMLKSAKANANRESGALKKSIIRKVKTYKSGLVAGLIGANMAFVASFKGMRRVPANYIHLVERGHGGKTTAKGSHFLNRAFESNKDKSAEICKDKIADVVQKEAKKLGKL